MSEETTTTGEDPPAPAAGPAADHAAAPEAVAVDEADATASSPGKPPPVVVHRWVQMVLLPMALLAAYALLRAAAPVFELFLVAGLVALILNPLVERVKRPRMPRAMAVAIVYLGFLVALLAAGYALAIPISDQARSFGRDAPKIERSANRSLDDVQDYLDRQNVKIKIRKQGQSALQTLSDKVVGGTDDVVSTGKDLVESAVRAGAQLVLVLVLSIYMLVYAPRIGEVVRRFMPPGDGTPADDYPARVQRAVAGYVRGQALFSLAMGTGAGIALYLYGLVGIFPEGRTYAIAFGVFFGFMELIPFVGPFLGATPPVLVALFSDPLTAVWVALLFLALQQIEGHIVAPQIFGHALRINPILVIFALLVGGELYGFVGALIALPIAAVVRETAEYLSEHVRLEPWGRAAPATVLSGAPPPAEGEGSDRVAPVASDE